MNWALELGVVPCCGTCKSGTNDFVGGVVWVMESVSWDSIFKFEMYR